VKEIDFLPDWYKNGRRRQIGYSAQYIALGGILVVMVVWISTMTYLASRASQELEAARPEQQEAESVLREFASVQKQVDGLKEKAEVMTEIGSRIDVANVLAELSFLIDEKVTLSTVQIIAEKFAEEKKKGSSRTAVRTASGKRGEEKDLSSDVRFKVVISGIAVDAGCVADLICKLEDSPYFCLVYPSFSKEGQIKDQTRRSDTRGSALRSMEDHQVSRFEISCYLANYKQHEERLTRKPQTGKGSA
jgi:hypothetical protein